MRTRCANWHDTDEDKEDGQGLNILFVVSRQIPKFGGQRAVTDAHRIVCMS
jgi:hypothetical protein